MLLAKKHAKVTFTIVFVIYTYIFVFRVLIFIPRPQQGYKVLRSPCLHVCPLAYLKNLTSKFYKILQNFPHVNCGGAAGAMARSFSQISFCNGHAHVSSTSPGGGTKGEVCRLPLHLFLLQNSIINVLELCQVKLENCIGDI